MSIAPDHIAYLKEHPDFAWYGSVLVTGILILAAIIVAVRGEQKAEREGGKNRMLPLVGMLCSAVAFFVFSVLYLFPYSKATVAENHVIEKTVESPPVGSLRYVFGTMKIDARDSMRSITGQIFIEIHNDTNKMIYFHAKTRGNINRTPFNENPVEFDGYISPNDRTYLSSARLQNLKQNEKNEGQPALLGIYEYELFYRFVDEKDWSRSTERGLRFESWPKIEFKNPGTTKETQLVVAIYHSAEK